MHNRPLALTFNGVIVPILSRPIGAIFADDYNVGLSSRRAQDAGHFVVKDRANFREPSFANHGNASRYSSSAFRTTVALGEYIRFKQNVKQDDVMI